jgi:hypothetical protein
VIKPTHARKFKRILAAVDVAQSDTDQVALAKTIIGLATSLVQIGKSELLIIHACVYNENP